MHDEPHEIKITGGTGMALEGFLSTPFAVTRSQNLIPVRLRWGGLGLARGANGREAGLILGLIA